MFHGISSGSLGVIVTFRTSLLVLNERFFLLFQTYLFQLSLLVTLLIIVKLVKRSNSHEVIDLRIEGTLSSFVKLLFLLVELCLLVVLLLCTH